MTCTCTVSTTGGVATVYRDPDCRTHGLPAGYSAHPPLRRHARKGEDDRTVERRLYAEAMGIRGDAFPRPFRDCPQRFGQR
jgi:hypothetical protein